MSSPCKRNFSKFSKGCHRHCQEHFVGSRSTTGNISIVGVYRTLRKASENGGGGGGGGSGGSDGGGGDGDNTTIFIAVAERLVYFMEISFVYPSPMGKCNGRLSLIEEISCFGSDV
ncbi:hypothetical protein HZH68_012097 [Vespula germanica]|uniref:Uncharacterized protein n=1 Tax=Vespula germanica TaxID=30212 RepID=A0A834MYQ0_VESGE|nr:hypothetical protein HZH68_012097 [Vespula germanica]